MRPQKIEGMSREIHVRLTIERYDELKQISEMLSQRVGFVISGSDIVRFGIELALELSADELIKGIRSTLKDGGPSNDKKAVWQRAQRLRWRKLRDQRNARI